MKETPWLIERARRTPGAPALVLPNERLTWADLEQQARALSNGFEHQGIVPGDIVATRLSSAEFAVTVHALWLRGATVLPLNARLTITEAAFQLRDSGATWLIVGSVTSEEVRDSLLEAVPDLRLLGVEVDDAQSHEAWVPLELDRPCAILYTSGTTGAPKGAILTARSFRASARASQQHLGSRETDRCLACMPLFHVGGLSILARSVLSGSCVFVHEGFDEEAVANALDNDAITDVSFVANMLARVLVVRRGRPAPASLRTVLLGGGPVPQTLLRDARALGYPIAPTYGLTEATSQVATQRPDDPDALGAHPLPGVEVRIDSVGRAEGEVLVRGETIMRGYCNRPEETASALRDGWLHTGDIGRLNRDGTLTILDRRSDLIISGGENIYPAELESVLSAHPGIAEVGVGRRADERFGERPVAWVVAVEGTVLDEDELVEFCQKRLAPFKVPRDFVACRELPRNATGKLLRAKLRFPNEHAG